MVSFPFLMTTPSRIDQKFDVRYEYPVVFTRGLFQPGNPALADAVARLGESRRHRMIAFADAGVLRKHPHLAAAVDAYAAAHADRLELVGPVRSVAGGESAKNDLMGIASMVNAIVDKRLCRQSVVLAIGGGAALDAVGFAAALVHRGLRLIRVPTTVLAQDDSGVGVKNAVNFAGTKNLLGTFAPPFAVLNDFDFLATLPDREWTDGVAEAFKVAILKDPEFFRWLCARAGAIRTRDGAAMEHLVRRCAELHLAHIRSSGDPFEFGQARPLDFGHWSAHRLESASSHRISHGHAVAIGIALDAAYAAGKGWLDAGSFDAILRGLAEAGFPLWDDLLARQSGGQPEILRGLRDFQEHLGGELCVTMPRGIGASFEVHEMDAVAVAAAIGVLRERASALAAR